MAHLDAMLALCETAGCRRRQMLAYFGEALGSDLPPIGVALARTITAIHSGSFFGDIQRLTTQGNVLLGDPALHVDPVEAAHVLRIHGRPALPVRDAALACRLAVEANFAGHEAFNICAPNTIMERPTAELVTEYLPSARLRTSSEGNWAGYDSEKSRKMLGFRAGHLLD